MTTLTVTEKATETRMRLAATTKQIRIRLTNTAVSALREMAAREFRDPQQQAAYILEQALLGEAAQDVCVGPSEVSEEG